MNRKLAALVFAAIAAPALAQTPPSTPAPAAAEAPAAKPKRTSVAEQDLLVRSVFGVLLGEFALQRNQPETALGVYLDLAQRSKDPQVLERACEIALHLRQLDVALELAQRWTSLQPESFKAQQTLTTVLLLANRGEELGDQLALMLKWDKERIADNLLGLNRLLARMTDKKAASKLVDRLTTPYRDMAEAHFAMAQAALFAGEHVRARVESARVVEIKPDWERGVLLRVQVLAHDAPGEAIELLQNFLARDAQAVDARLALARLLLAGKRYPEALQQFLRVVELAPDANEALFPAAMLSLQQRDLEGGRKLLQKLLDGNYADKGSLHFFLGQIDEEQGKLDAALEHYREVGAGEQYLPARSRAAHLLVQQGRNEEALRLLNETSGKTAEEKTRLALAEANLLRDDKRYAEALAKIEAALKTAPDDIDLLYERGMLAERLGRAEVFEKTMQRILELKPDHAHALNALGYTWADQNRKLDEAYALIKKAADLAPEDPFIMDSLGWVLFRQGKLAEAEKTLRAAYALRPDPEIAAHLGEVLWQAGQRDEASQLWRKAAKADPKNEELGKVIRKFLP